MRPLTLAAVTAASLSLSGCGLLYGGKCNMNDQAFCCILGDEVPNEEAAQACDDAWNQLGLFSVSNKRTSVFVAGQGRSCDPATVGTCETSVGVMSFYEGFVYKNLGEGDAGDAADFCADFEGTFTAVE